jgi:hypothetical protein
MTIIACPNQRKQPLWSVGTCEMCTPKGVNASSTAEMKSARYIR